MSDTPRAGCDRLKPREAWPRSYWNALAFELPPTEEGAVWRRWIDTALASPEDICEETEAPPVAGPTCLVQPHSIAYLFAQTPRLQGCLTDSHVGGADRQDARTLKEDAGFQSARRLAIITVCAVLAQSALGAGFRHGAFGIAPHIAAAVVVSLIATWTTFVILRRYGGEGYLRRPALAVLVLISCQINLGLLAYVARLKSYADPQPLEPMITLTVAHVVVGALTLAGIVVLGLRCWRMLSPARESKAPLRMSNAIQQKSRRKNLRPANQWSVKQSLHDYSLGELLKKTGVDERI